MKISTRWFTLLSMTMIALCACETKIETTPAGDSLSAIDTTQLAPGATNTPIDTMPAVDTTGPVATQVAVMTTDLGDIEIELYGKDAPKTVENFVKLSNKGFYKGIGFHRVVPGYVIQAGDPLSKDTTKRDQWGSGGESSFGGTFEDELNPSSPSGRRGYVEGTVAMANRGPNTNSSQFFIVLNTQQASGLPYNYTIFGFVRKGMEVVRKIEETGMGGELVINPVRIKSVKITDVPVVGG